MSRRMRTLLVAVLTTGFTTLGVAATVTPASACQPESCPPGGGPGDVVCEALRHFPKLPQCIPPY
ncbi:MAG: hypothetical protein ABR520_06720 [Mycobacteriales bacterium]|nr:hypothetical protein [Frankia sp.]